MTQQHWRLVPGEADSAMLDAARLPVHDAVTAEAFRNMLAAAPAPAEWLHRAHQLIDALEWKSSVLAKLSPLDDNREERAERDAARAALWKHLESVEPPR